MKSPILSYFILFFGVFALSTSAIFVKIADAPAAITAFYRL
ncbi:EamA family transporter, partial [Bacillus mycoides]|nr:EamA family transporter [Bacillus mycoides]